MMHTELLHQLEWRCIGPHRGGRVVAVAGDPTHPATFYFGSTGGGVWKTTDGGHYWENVSDGFFQRASVGALAVAPSDPQVIYAGMGETTIRSNVSHGDGVYRSTDGGRTWQHRGLAATRNIGKVRVHPADPDTVYVAAFGHVYGPNPERGVFRSRDGGATWEHVLVRSAQAGANDLVLDPHNPRIIYAACWEAQRGPHFLSSGGPGSSLYRSTDGGDTWTDLTSNPGLPAGLKGKIGVALAPTRAGRVWALVEADDGGIFRSDDGGATWVRLSADRNLRQRAWYYSHIIADPQDAETVWVLNVETWRSLDGGKTFDKVPAPHGDNHDLWIDPRDPQRMILGNDGGGAVSFNGGRTWSSLYNQPTGEFYHVTTDSRTPYRVYGAQQDNTTICVASRSRYDAITQTEWYEVGGGESGYIAVRPDNPDIVYAGSFQGYLTRYDHRNRQVRAIPVWPRAYSGWAAQDQAYRFQWTAPILLSPHDPHVLYTASNIIFRSTNEGVSWEPISPDLTRADPATLVPSGGPITRENTGAEVYATVFALAESPLTLGLLWAGSDDGLVHLSRDGGATWTNITPPDLPEWALISIIEPSPHDPAAAYLAATRYKLDDLQPYLYKTADYGATWTRITAGIPVDVFTRVVRADPARRGLLYAGTEAGIYVSFDDGARWLPLAGTAATGKASAGRTLPVTPIHDMAIKADDLVVATHGRAFWILDDLTQVRQIADMTAATAAHLFKPRDTIRFVRNGGFEHKPVPGVNYGFSGGIITTFHHNISPDGQARRTYIDVGSNPPDGVIITYRLPEPPPDRIILTILDAEGHEIRSFCSKPPPPPPGEPEPPPGSEPHIPNRPGLNRFVWNMRYAEATRVTIGGGDREPTVAPLALPGVYKVGLSIDNQTQFQTFAIVPDPSSAASAADLAAQFDLLMQIRDKLAAAHAAVNQIRRLRGQVEAWIAATAPTASAAEVAAAARRLIERLASVEAELIQVKAEAPQDTLNFPVKLNASLAFLAWIVSQGDAAPTRADVALYAELAAETDAQIERLGQIVAADVTAFNNLIAAAALPAVIA